MVPTFCRNVSRRLFVWFGKRHVSMLLNDNRPAAPSLWRW